MPTDKKKLSQLTGKIWADGALVEWQDATVHILSHGLHYGTGVFEGVRAYATADGPAIFRLGDHTRRLLNSAKVIGMPCPFSFEQLCEAQLQVVAVNNLANAYIRPVMFYDDTGLGLSVDKHGVRVFIATMEWGAYLGKEALEKGIRTGISSFRRHTPSTSMCRAKVTGNYINSVLANQEAKANGFDEALLLDTEGFVSEGSGENLFAVKDGVLLTPALDSVLDGITRQTVMVLAREQGLKISARRLTRDELYTMDEVFLTGTAAEITPIYSIDNREIGDGKRGCVTEKLQKAYFDCVFGRNHEHAEWLYLVGPSKGKTAVS